MSEGVREQSELVTRSFGPFVRGLVDTWPASAGDPQGALRRAEGVYLWGEGQLRSIPLPAATPNLLRNAAATNVVTDVEAAVVANAAVAGDNPIFFAVGYQADTTGLSPRTIHVHQCGPYPYRWSDFRSPAGAIGDLAANNTLLGTLSAAQSPATAPWTTVARSPRITVVAVDYILHIAANVVGGFYQTYDCTTAVVAAPPGPSLVRGLFSFQRHLWGYGGATASSGAVLSFGTPDYGPLNAGSTLTLPDAGGRITDIVGALPLLQATVVCTTDGAFLLTGYGRNTWQTTRVAGFAGVVGERAFASDLTTAYAVGTDGNLWAIAADSAAQLPTPAALSEPGLALNEAVVAVDIQNQWVIITIPTVAASAPASRLFIYDIRRQVWVSGNTGIGIKVSCGAQMPNNYPLRPYLGNANLPPKGPPLSVTVTPTVGGGDVSWTGNAGVNNWFRMDFEVKRTVDGASAWEVWHSTNAEASPKSLTGLASGVSYDLRIRYRPDIGYTSAYTATSTWVTL